jgi:hypothetical protein
MQFIISKFEKNPLAWIALICFFYAEYSLYQRGKEVELVCGLVSNYVSLDVIGGTPKNDSEKAIRVCYDRLTGSDF